VFFRILAGSRRGPALPDISRISFEIFGSKFPAAAIRKLRLRQDFIYWNSTSSGRSLLA
jgi:hypothetical protein